MNKTVTDMLIVAGSTLCIYIYLAIFIRIFNRRQLSQLTALDLLIVILLGSSVETAMVNGSTLLRMGFVSATTLLVANKVITSVLARSKKLSRLFCSGPVLLVRNGIFIEDHLRSAGLSHEDVMEALREREQADLSKVRYAILEPDGEINVISSHVDDSSGVAEK